MAYHSIYDLFELSQAVHRGFVHTLPIHPLEHVCAVGEKVDPLLIIRYDFHPHSRVFHDVPRIKPLCTHASLTVLSGRQETPLNVGFGAACFIETYDGHAFVPVNPRLREQADLFDALDELPVLQQIRHPMLKACVEGQLNEESWRYADNCLSTRLTATQLKHVQKVIAEWHKTPPSYQVLARQGENCQSFIASVLHQAGITPPVWWTWRPWPPLAARLLEQRTLRRHDLVQDGAWLLQSSMVTQRMHHRVAAHRFCALRSHSKSHHSNVGHALLPAQ